METQFLFEGEKILLTSDDKKVILTNKRIRRNNSSAGQAHITSIHLEKISSIEIHYKSMIFVLLLGLLLLISGLVVLMQTQDGASIAGIVLGGVFMLVYMMTRRYIITIASDGGAKINILAKGMEKETVLNFVNKIEHAKSIVREYVENPVNNNERN